VLELQKLLNQRKETQVALTGPGSPGLESTYFGQKTFIAVIAFQQLYAKDVLIPAGLIRATGTVGPLTRAKLNALSNVISRVSLPKATLPASIGPVIEQITPNRGGYGTIVTISGTGFSQQADNKLYVGYDTLTGRASTDGKTLSFMIPSYIPHLAFTRDQLADLPEASLPFWIYVGNKTGDSNSELFTFTFYNQ
jgi:hypothetical protein